MVKAALIAADIDPPRWHDIDGLVHLLPGDNQLRGMLFPLARFAPYAVAYRYPVPDPDVLPDIPTTDEVTAWLGELEHVMAAVAVAIGTS